MCGISAIIFDGRGPGTSVPSLEAMNGAIRHRGPDDEGYVLFPENGAPMPFGGSDTPEDVFIAGFPYSPKEPSCPNFNGDIAVAFGHRRLSIVDLSPAGHQPMCSSDQRFWIVFNGEIYNYRELRTDLKAIGHSFHTETDTEVILHAYAEWGRNCLSRFNGMFAFVILDRETSTIFAARDRFGIKPLYYWLSPEGFLAFASEIKQFTFLPGWRARLNHQRAFDFLTYALIDHTKETLFAGVNQLRGGEAMEVPLKEFSRSLPIFQWYTFIPETTPHNYQSACDRFRALFTDSVRLRLRADVPIGSCLSGGLDSSAIVCVTNDLLKQEGDMAEVQRTFSATTTVKQFDESAYIHTVVLERNIDAHYTCADIDDLLTELDQLIWHQDEPFGSTSIYAQWSVFKLAANTGMKVMLDGQGADEQLCGYHTFFPVRYADLFRSGRWGKLFHELCLSEKKFGYPLKRSILEMAFFVLPDVVRRPIQEYRFRDMVTPPWIDTSILHAPLRINDYLPPNYRIDDLSYSQLFHSSLPMLLHWEDRDSMAHSIESRVPFLDFRLVEFIMGLPTEYRLAGCRTKQVLRDSMKGILPESIRERQDKIGFATGEVEWIRNQNPMLFRSMVANAIENSHGILNDEAKNWLEEVISGERSYSTDYFIWRWICFGRWMKLFSVEV